MRISLILYMIFQTDNDVCDKLTVTVHENFYSVEDGDPSGMLIILLATISLERWGQKYD